MSNTDTVATSALDSTQVPLDLPAVKPQRRSSRIERKPIYQIKEIQTLLKDVYKDSGDGRTLVRELIQNADDAKAKRLVVAIVREGWPEATNGLLRGSALVVANDAPFPESDRDAMHQAMGGSKAEHVEKVGRFGVGLKSLFHICEAFVYLGVDGKTPSIHPGALNPWAGTGDVEDRDPLHPDWDEVNDPDLARLTRLSRSLLGDFSDGLLLWIPLRGQQHRDRGSNRQSGLGDKCWSHAEILDWFKRPVPITLLMAQCAHVASVTVFDMTSPQGTLPAEPIAKVERPGFSPCAWVGRPKHDSKQPVKPFSGTIRQNSATWQVTGVEALGLSKLQEIRARDDWPRDLNPSSAQMLDQPMKALAHAAVSVLVPEIKESRLAIRVRWAVFLPLDDDPSATTAPTVEFEDHAKATNAIEILLHGYFWPSHDRRSIPGVVGDAENDNDLRAHWNRTLRDELLLPLLPQALERALSDLPSKAAQSTMELVCRLPVVSKLKKAVIRRDLLLPTIQEAGVRWKVYSASNTTVLSIPSWSEAPNGARAGMATLASRAGSRCAIVDRDSTALCEEPARWPEELFEQFLDAVTGSELRDEDAIRWVAGFIRHVLGTQADAADPRSVVAARWFVARVADACLIPPKQSSANKNRDHWDDTWRSLAETLPADWLLNAPKKSRAAVQELATMGVLGEGLIPLPLGVPPYVDERLKVESSRITSALQALGKLLSSTTKVSAELNSSRLVLAEILLSAVSLESLPSDLINLPMLRVKKFPDGKEESHSISKLRANKSEHRAFCGPGEEDDETASVDDVQKDHKQSIIDLADALAAPVWLVMSPQVAKFAGVTQPTAVNLAESVTRAKDVSKDPTARRALLKRLGDGRDTSHPSVREAILGLLTGYFPPLEGAPRLYYVPNGCDGRDDLARCLSLLLKLLARQWTAVDAELVNQLPRSIDQDFKLKAVDSGALHSLLDECLRAACDFSQFSSDDAVHLLRQLSSTNPVDKERWKRAPLHKMSTGERRAIDSRTFRTVGQVPLPPELTGEVRILDPDPGLETLYSDIQVLDDGGILSVMLISNQPWRFAKRILEALFDENRSRVVLPRRTDVLELLKGSPWLPLSQTAGGSAPKTVLLLPPGLQRQVIERSLKDAIKGRCLEADLEPRLAKYLAPVVREILGNPSESDQMQDFARAIDLANLAVSVRDQYLILPANERLSHETVSDALQSSLVNQHQGWSLLKTVHDLLHAGHRQLALASNPPDVVLSLGRRLCGTPSNSSSWVKALQELASTKPGKETPPGRFFRILLGECAKNPQFFREVLPNIELPTQDGQWRNPKEIARSASGVARRHCLLEELRAPLRLGPDSAGVAQASSNKELGARKTSEKLARYFHTWKNRVSNQAVGAFLCLLGETHEGVAELAQEWLGEDVNVEGVRSALLGVDRQRIESLKLFVRDEFVSGKIVKTENLLGEEVDMESSIDSDSIFAFDPVRKSSLKGPFWEVTLRDAGLEKRTSLELSGLLLGTVEWWARHALGVNNIQAWWQKWGSGSQAQIEPVRASILAHLPLILHQLDVRENPQIFDALRKAQHAQRMREQAQQDRLHEAIKAEREALNGLADTIEGNPKNQEFVWHRVQAQMRRFGYGQDSVLLELVQNADDALVQAEEITGRRLADEARTVTIRLTTQEQTSKILDFRHYGRPINYTGGAGFPRGRQREWDQDLYFMLVMNLSGKSGETPGKPEPSATTGQFGLGFKSVHLISQAPAVVSGFHAFSILAGLLPKEYPKQSDADLVAVDGQQPTRIRLPLQKDENSADLIQALFSRFRYAQALIPAFARAITHIIVDGGPVSGVSRFDGIPLVGASGWSIARDTVHLPSAGQWRLLRYRPGDEKPELPTVALVVGIQNGEPRPLPETLPFIWNVTPTSEAWGCGYAVNGPFKLDPGRTHVSLENVATIRSADILGKTLGESLLKLHDSLEAATAETNHPLGQIKDVERFLPTLWEILAAGLDSPDQSRRGFLMRLHGPGRGISQWMSSRAVVPSGLPLPFSPKLPKLSPASPFEVAGAAFDDPNVINALNQMTELSTVAAERRVVSRKIAGLLAPLMSDTPKVCQPGDLLQLLAGRWNNQVTSQRLHSLRPLAEDTVFKAIHAFPHAPEWASLFTAKSRAGTERPFKRLLLPHAHGLDAADPDIQDELARSAFADDDWVLDATYLETAADVKLFRRLRGAHEADAKTMASWCGRSGMPEARQNAGLRYIMSGRLGAELIGLLAPVDKRPTWLQSFDELNRRLVALGAENWRIIGLLARLFPERFQQTKNENGGQNSNYIKVLFDQWKDEGQRSAVLTRYEERAWPEFLRRDGIAASLQADSRDHWLGLLILGACRGLGRATEEQHRSFLDWTSSEGWWEVFQEPEQQASWMEKLEAWQDSASANLKWGRWMSLFPTIFQLSRHVDKYKRLLKGAGRRPADFYNITNLLAPKVDEKLSGAGANYDAPPAPLNMGLHWVLRELVRMHVIDGEHIYPDCWVPSEQLLRFLNTHGMPFPGSGTSNGDKAKCVHEFLGELLEDESPTFMHAFDIPLLFAAGNSSFDIDPDTENDG